MEHARRSRGGLSFNGYASFETCVDRVLSQPELASAMGQAGRRYVEDNFAWPVVTDRYQRWLQRLADPAANGAGPGANGAPHASNSVPRGKNGAAPVGSATALVSHGVAHAADAAAAD